MKRLDVVVVNYNAGAVLARCLDSVMDQPAVAGVTVVDNGSTDGSLELQQLDQVSRLIKLPDNPGFSTACNQGAKVGSSEWLVFLNPDAWFEPGALKHLAETIENNDSVGMYGVEVLDEQGQRQRATVRAMPELPGSLSGFWRLFSSRPATDLNTGDHSDSRIVPAVSGACMVVRRAAFEAIGGFDEGFRLHGEDLDLMRRLGDAGWEIRWLPGVVVRHVQGVSSRARPAWVHWHKHQGMRRYLKKHELTDRSRLIGLMAETGVMLRFLLTLPGALIRHRGR